MSDSDLRKDLDDALAGIRSLQNRIGKLENQSSTTGGMPTTALLSKSFFRRAFTVWGHNFVAELIITIPILFFVLIIIGLVHGLR